MDVDKKSCALCIYAEEELWPEEKTALHCRKAGARCGWVTQIFPTGHRLVVAEYPAPKWCNGFEPMK